jgi:hypothetical protein
MISGLNHCLMLSHPQQVSLQQGKCISKSKINICSEVMVTGLQDPLKKHLPLSNLTIKFKSKSNSILLIVGIKDQICLKSGLTTLQKFQKTMQMVGIIIYCRDIEQIKWRNLN